MGIRTKIEYCDSTVNPTSGCDGCELWIPKKGGSCYAGAIHTRFRGTPEKPNLNYPGPFEQVDEQPKRMKIAANWPDLRGTERPEKPWLNGLPRVIFISDMSDALSQDITFPYLLDQVIGCVSSPSGRRHRWMWFTKQPRRMAEFSEWLQKLEFDWPDHLMAVTSVTSAKTLGRLRHLAEVRCKLKGISFEPLWGPITREDLERHVAHDFDFEFDFGLACQWVAVGGESGAHAKPMHPAWARALRDFCAQAGVPFFFKQWGEWIHESELDQERFEEVTSRFSPNCDAHLWDDGFSFPLGKKHSGRLLDGREHNGMPWRAESRESEVGLRC